MDWNERFIAVDWGTTNRRAYAISGTVVVDRFEDDLGMTSVPVGGFDEAAAAIAERLASPNLLLAGMVGSNRGWADAGYVRAPAGIADVADAVYWIKQGEVGIVPGIRLETGDRHDVMRGEEVQAFGAVIAGQVAPDALVCHPGTHTKWIELVDGRIGAFTTAVTGELYSLLSKHSILAAQIVGEAKAGEAFAAGVDLAIAGRPLLDTIFEVRSRGLAGVLSDRDAASILSGMLIGCDVVAHPAPAGTIIALIGRPELIALYGAAIERSGGRCAAVDGADAFVAGMIAIRDRLT